MERTQIGGKVVIQDDQSQIEIKNAVQVILENRTGATAQYKTNNGVFPIENGQTITFIAFPTAPINGYLKIISNNLGINTPFIVRTTSMY